MMRRVRLSSSLGGIIRCRLEGYRYPGSYYLIACADNTTTVTESDETNNCLASTTTVQVLVP